MFNFFESKSPDQNVASVNVELKGNLDSLHRS